MDIVLMKTPGGTLAPVDQTGIDYIAKLKTGAGVRVKATKYNNVAFHRKLYALLNVAYDAWDPAPVMHKGEPITKTIEQFREDLTILAGYYESSVRLDGSIRFTAKSWAFGSMDDVEKEKMYSSIINVVLAKILTGSTRADLDDIVENVLRFA